MTDALDATLAEARSKLAAGDAQAAFLALKPPLSYPAASLDDTARFQRALGAFAGVARAIAGPALGDLADAVAARPDDPQALYDLAYQLYEQGLHGIAATLLARANRLAPGEPGIVTELCACLEATMQYGLAALTVDTSGLAEHDPVCAYLSGFDWLMSGDLDIPRKRLAQLASVTTGPVPEMRDALIGMVARADAIRAAGVALDDRALTAWQAVIDGTVLLHESPHGHDEPMHGRYAFVNDAPSRMREGLERLSSVLSACERTPARVVSAPDRASRILAIAAARMLGLPLVPFRATEPTSGLVVAWSMEAVEDAAFHKACFEHAPGQILFVHASSWVEPFPYAPDVTTLLHQVVRHPYTGGAPRLDPETRQVAPAPPDPRSDEACADEILRAEPSDPSVSDLALVRAVAHALGALPEAQRGGLHRSSGRRHRQRAGSPVPSNRFA